MAYQLIEFDSVPLPVYNPRQMHDPMASESGVLRSIGGHVDYFGTRAAPFTSQILSITGVYLHNAPGYIVDEECNRLVDENGDYIVYGDAPTMLLEDLAALRSKVRRSGRLVRRRLNDGYREWKTARMQAMQQPQEVRDRDFMATVTCAFEILDEGWHAETPTVAGRELSDGTTKTLYVQNGGALPILDAVLTVTRMSGTITQIDIESADAGIDLRWTGTLSSGALEIDCAHSTVRANGVDAYVSTLLQAGHTARSWLPLAPGITPLTLTVTGGDARVSVEYYLQHP